MELHWSRTSSGKHGAAGEGFSIGKSRTITQILERNPEDDFKCTYFRQRTTRTPTKEKKGGGLFPMSICYTLPSELSDGYTDSDSESDNTSHVERWLESLPSNDAWSSVPNYLALDGSEGFEGVDEIQEDIKKSRENELMMCQNNTNDSRKNFTAETKDSKVRVTEGDLVKPISSKQDEISIMAEWLDRQSPRKKMERIFKTRQKIPVWTKLERESKNGIRKEKLLNGKANEKTHHFLTLSKNNDIPKRNICIDQGAAVWSNSNTLETTESRAVIKTVPSEEDCYDEMMEEMVLRLLTVSDVENRKNESFSRIVGNDSNRLCDSKESKETVNSSILRLGNKKARLSTTFKKLSPKLTKTKINENRLEKVKPIALKTVTKKKQKRNPKKRILQGRIKPCITKRELKPVQKSRYSIANQSFVENIDPGKKTRSLKSTLLSRTVRFQDEVTMQTSPEDWRLAAIVKAERNKRILQTVEQIVDNIEDEGLHYGKETIRAESGKERKLSSNLFSETKPKNVSESKKYSSWRSNRKRPMHSIDNKKIGSRKPMFTNPFVESCLDKAMDIAMSRYKCPKNTWEDFIKAKSRENMSSIAYEPPAKKSKPKSITSKIENMIGQDFSLFNSWQSIHNYFLLYSACK